MAKDKEEEEETCTSCIKKMSFPYNTTFLIVNSIFLVTTFLWFVTVSIVHYKNDECKRFETAPRIFVSFTLLVMVLTGFYAAYFKSDCLFRIHFFLYILWMFGVVAKAVFVISLHKETHPRLFPGTNIYEFKLEDYSDWVSRLVIKEDEWYRTKRCLIKRDVCNSLFSNQNMTASEFYQMKLTPIQSGCCKPPLRCGFGYEKPNSWKVITYNTLEEDDCNTWNNKEDTLCFDCDSCRAVVIEKLRNYKAFSVSFSLIHFFFCLFIGIVGRFAWLRTLQETQT